MNLKNCEIIHLRRIEDGNDGTISVAEEHRDIPFKTKRVYYIYDLNNASALRGKHAHKELEQVIFCMHGSYTIGLDDGTNQMDIRVEDPSMGVYLGPELWHTMYDFSDDCVLMVMASDYYNESDYIRNYDEFKTYLKNQK